MKIEKLTKKQIEENYDSIIELCEKQGKLNKALLNLNAKILDDWENTNKIEMLIALISWISGIALGILIEVHYG